MFPLGVGTTNKKAVASGPVPELTLTWNTNFYQNLNGTQGDTHEFAAGRNFFWIWCYEETPPPNLTIDGVAATRLLNNDYESGDGMSIAFWTIDLPTGGPKTFVWSGGSTFRQLLISTYATTNWNGVLADSEAMPTMDWHGGNRVFETPNDLNIPANGLGIAIFISSQGALAPIAGWNFWHNNNGFDVFTATPGQSIRPRMTANGGITFVIAGALAS